MTWMQTRSGKVFDFKNPVPEMIDLDDILYSLNNVCRYGGHIGRFYSVLEHSILVSDLVAKEFKKEALFHDATEAYIGDMVTPLKQMNPAFMEYEEKLWKVIARKFDLNPVHSQEVKDADHHALYLEVDQLFAPRAIDNWHHVFDKRLKYIQIPRLGDAVKKFKNLLIRLK